MLSVISGIEIAKQISQNRFMGKKEWFPEGRGQEDE